MSEKSRQNCKPAWIFITMMHGSNTIYQDDLLPYLKKTDPVLSTLFLTFYLLIINFE